MEDETWTGARPEDGQEPAEPRQGPGYDVADPEATPLDPPLPLSQGVPTSSPSDDIDKLIRSMPQGGRIEIYRRKPRHCEGFLEAIEVAPGDTIEIAELARIWGGGTLQLRPKVWTQSDGWGFAPGSATVRIAGKPLHRGAPIDGNGQPIPQAPVAVMQPLASTQTVPHTPIVAQSADPIVGLLMTQNAQANERASRLEARLFDLLEKRGDQANAPTAQSAVRPGPGTPFGQVHDWAQQMQAQKKYYKVLQGMFGVKPDEDEDEDEGGMDPMAMMMMMQNGSFAGGGNMMPMLMMMNGGKMDGDMLPLLMMMGNKQPQQQQAPQAANVQPQQQQQGMTQEQMMWLLQQSKRGKKGKKKAAPWPMPQAQPQAAPTMQPQAAPATGQAPDPMAMMATLMGTGSAPSSGDMAKLFGMLPPEQAAKMSELFSRMQDDEDDAEPIDVEAGESEFIETDDDQDDEPAEPPTYGGVVVPMALRVQPDDDDDEESDPFADVGMDDAL